MPKLSVIIPTHNRLPILKETLASLPLCRYKDLEVIVVDDASTDGTSEWLKGHPRIHLISQTNSGPSCARNKGADLATGDYLAFLDSDDLWFPWTLDTYLDAIKESGATFLAGKPFVFREKHSLDAIEHPKNLELNEFQDYLSSGDYWRWWGCSSFIIHRDSFLSVGGFHCDWLNGEDADMALRLGTVRGFAQITAPYTFGYRRHSDSEMKNMVRTWAGARHMLNCLKSKAYPGLPDRKKEVLRIATRHLRPIAFEAIIHNESRLVWEIYRATFAHHLSTHRWRFIFGLPIRFIMGKWKKNSIF